MPLVDRLKRNEYIKKWKQRKRISTGIMPGSRGKFPRQPMSDLDVQTSHLNRKEYQRQWKRKETIEHPEVRLYRAAKRRAKDKGLPFDLEKSDVVVPTHCPYLGIELVPTRKRGDSRRDIASLDRIIPELGYVKGNIEVISWQANTMKSDATPELLLKFANTILKRHGNYL